MNEINKLDPFGGANLRPLGRCVKRRPGSTLNKPKDLCWEVEGLNLIFHPWKGWALEKGAFFIYPLSKGDFSELPVSQSPNIFKKRRDPPFHPPFQLDKPIGFI